MAQRSTRFSRNNLPRLTLPPSPEDEIIHHEKTPVAPIAKKSSSVNIPLLKLPPVAPIVKRTTAAPIVKRTTAAPIVKRTTAAPIVKRTTAAPIVKRTTAVTVDSVAKDITGKKYQMWKQLFELIFDLQELGVSFFGSVVRDHLVPLVHDGLWLNETFDKFLNQPLTVDQRKYFQSLLRRPFPNDLDVVNSNLQTKYPLDLFLKNFIKLKQKWEIRGVEMYPVYSSSDGKTCDQYQFVVFPRNKTEMSIVVKMMLTPITSKQTSDLNVNGLFYSLKNGIHTIGVPFSPDLINQLIQQCLYKTCRVGKGVSLNRIVKMINKGWKITNLKANFIVKKNYKNSCYRCKIKPKTNNQQWCFFFCCGYTYCEKCIYDITESTVCFDCGSSHFCTTVNGFRR